MNEQLNIYGDSIIDTTGSHGVDVASQRFDELDRACIRFVLDMNALNGCAIDLGCGLGIQGMRMSLLGVPTVLVDMLDITERVQQFMQLTHAAELRFVRTDARNLNQSDIQKKILIVYSQRFFHYLKYDEATELLRDLAHQIAPEARLFLSASGLESELGQGYEHVSRSVLTRFCNLRSDMADAHRIQEPICLYRLEEFIAMVESAGYLCIDAWKSKFGNVKGIFRPR